MTEPKKEKCEACCVDGYIGFRTDDGHISMRTCRRCDGYGYIKVEQMTNEEWFCGLSTEEKAKWLSRNSKFMYGCGRMETTPKIMYEEDWEWWLKEKHDEMS